MQNIFLVTLAILVGLLWAGTIDNEMKWTATMFGLALMAVIANGGTQARSRRRR
jgi:MFS-type transporter involved in bile tolerance (Atg22 family)